MKTSGETINAGGDIDSGSEEEKDQKRIGQAANQTSVLEKYKDMTRFWAERYRIAELDYNDSKKNSGVRMSSEEFEKWEDDAKRFFENMLASEKKAGLTSANRYERDMVEKIGGLNAKSSIEADAGDYYMPRLRALNNAIQESGNTKDLEVGERLYQCVGEHIYYEYDYETRRDNVALYEENRRHAHNKLIEQFNSMNDLARKYNVRPFTFRNFETNDYNYNKSLDPYRETDARSDYDRTIVETYCRNAFSSMYDKAVKDNR